MAVYTHITDEKISALLQRLGVGSLVSSEGITEGVENTNYLLNTSTGRYILTVIEKRANPEELPFYIGYMEHLKKRGIPCPAVLHDGEGRNVFTLEGKPALVSEFLQGAWPREIYAHHCQAAGETLAAMHRAGRDFSMKRKNSVGLAAWEALIQACAEKADTVEPGLYKFLTQELSYLHDNWPKYLPRGMVHADFFPDNVFFTDEKLTGVIDFYFSCTETLAYDLMLAMNPWCFDWKGDLDTGRSHAFLANYHKGRPLAKNELKSLPFFGRAAAMRIIATRLYDWLHPVEGALVRAKDPMEHVKILRFHQQVASLDDYGFTP
jgi:homoserine kinase type II